MSNVAQHLLWLGCTRHMEFSIVIMMLSIKFDYNGYFEEIMMLLKEINPMGNLVSLNIYETKKLVSKLSLTYKKIDYCINLYTVL